MTAQDAPGHIGCQQLRWPSVSFRIAGIQQQLNAPSPRPANVILPVNYFGEQFMLWVHATKRCFSASHADAVCQSHFHLSLSLSLVLPPPMSYSSTVGSHWNMLLCVMHSIQASCPTCACASLQELANQGCDMALAMELWLEQCYALRSDKRESDLQLFHVSILQPL